jgi:hypothetical protein
LQYRRQLETKFWTPYAGFRTGYVTDRNAVSNIELRPFLGTILGVPVIKNLLFEQELIYEQRFFFSAQSGRSISNPVSYRIILTPTLTYSFEAATGLLKGLSVFADYTWFFIQYNKTNERYTSERDFELGVKKEFKNNKVVYFSFNLEKYFSFDRNFTGHSKGITIKYTL